MENSNRAPKPESKLKPPKYEREFLTTRRRHFCESQREQKCYKENGLLGRPGWRIVIEDFRV
jgi:hypothetical protein